MPLWILNACIGLPLLVSTARVLFADTESEARLLSDGDRDDAFFEGVEHLVALVFFAMVLGTEIMLAQKYDGSVVRTLFAVFGPLYAAIGVLLLFGATIVWHAQPCGQDYEWR